MRTLTLFFPLLFLSLGTLNAQQPKETTEDLTALAHQAELQFLNGREQDAARMYEYLLRYDRTHLQANIYLGNYHFLQAEDEKAQLESAFRKLRRPTRMQRARFQNRLVDIFSNHYTKAKGYLQQVLLSFPSTQAEYALQKIGALEKALKRIR
ncbi:MAG: hypothetical protein LBM06_02315 [Prevotellaceae bacterium]|jgi:hypothetical protein|nr:hypothetical protein [Prevotellaceae bacterium]